MIGRSCKAVAKRESPEFYGAVKPVVAAAGLESDCIEKVEKTEF